MRIVIDVRMYGPERWTGIGRYTQALIEELGGIDATNHYLILLGSDNFDAYQPKHKNFQKILAPYPVYGFGEQLGLTLLLARLRPDLVHFTAPNAPLLYFGRRITTVHDLSLITHNTSRHTGIRRAIGGLKRAAFRLVMWWGIRRSWGVLTPSQYVKDQIVARYHTPQERIMVTPLAVDVLSAKPEPIDRFQLSPGYMLYVGNSYPYKNLRRLIDAFKIIHMTRRDLQLAIVGRDDHFRLELKQYTKDVGLGDHIVFTGAVSNGELASLYRQAGVFAYPSLSEGFGLPGLEAMCCGVPVVAADASCLPETCGQAARYFDPLSAPDMARALAEVLDDSHLQADMRRAGLIHVQAYSWRRTAQITHDAYESR